MLGQISKKTLTQKYMLSRSFHATSAFYKSVAIPFHPHLHAHTPLAESNNHKYAISYVKSSELGERKIEEYPELIIGWSSDSSSLDYKTFIENQKFVPFLTNTLKENIHKVNDTNLKAMADWQKEGWMHIGDERDPPAWGRINFPEDIIGSVQVINGIIQEGTYQAMPTHRLMTTKGIFQLSEPLTQCLIKAAKLKASQ